MTPLEAFRARFAQYRLHRALLGIDELNFFRQELDLAALSPEERQLIDDSQAAHESEEDDAWRTLEESGRSLEASERLNAELGEAKDTVEQQRDELQAAYATLEEQKKALEEQKQALEGQNRELVTTKDSLEAAKHQADQDLEDAIERLRLQQHLSLMTDRLRSQGQLLHHQNWLGPAVVAGTGILFWVTGEQIVAGAFVTLASMYLQTVAGGFSSFFGGSRDGHQEADKGHRR